MLLRQRIHYCHHVVVRARCLLLGGAMVLVDRVARHVAVINYSECLVFRIMENLVRQEVFTASRTLIIKLGSNVLTRDDDQLDLQQIRALGDQIHRLQQTGRRVVIVSSGAVAAGIGILNLRRRPNSLPELQAAAAAGQTHLMQAWENALAISRDSMLLRCWSQPTISEIDSGI